ncbi:hypothetical protein [Spirosoma rigui]|uniref:hypothetical protein n=1 Tax=Spirosoma rigui TaxID=564064 RepID=UPI001472E8DE|nr:hypothetical protein [Spirosoma rigui]
MKKQFAIKVAQVSKNVAVSAAKNETANVLKFLKPDGCCTTMLFQGFTAKPVFSL